MGARLKVLQLGKGGEQLPPVARDRSHVQVFARKLLARVGDGLGLLRVRLGPRELLGNVVQRGGHRYVVHVRPEQRVKVLV